MNIWRETNRLAFVCRFYLFIFGVSSGINLFPVFRQKRGRAEREFSAFVVLNCLQLKIIFMSKSNVFGWHIPDYFNFFQILYSYFYEDSKEFITIALCLFHLLGSLITMSALWLSCPLIWQEIGISLESPLLPVHVISSNADFL